MPENHSIVLAEDNENDLLLMRIALRKLGKEDAMFWCSDGENVISYLSSLENDLPKLIILDLKMLHTDGFETLRWIKNQPRLAALPVVILSCSSMPVDLNLALSLGATDYVVKPHDFTQFCERVKDFVGRYLT